MKQNLLGNKINELRRKKGITQRDLANALNISDKAISRWEAGVSVPNLEMIAQISKYFKVPFNDLVMARISCDVSDDAFLYKEIISDLCKQNNKRKWDVLKIIGILLSFFRLVVAIIDIFLNKIKC